MMFRLAFARASRPARSPLRPRLFAAALAGLAAVPSAAAAQGVVERNQSTFSEALGRPVQYNLYRPAVAPSDGVRWPVLYLLEGRPSESDWLDQGGLVETMDRAIAEGVMPPTLVVTPVAPFSWYVDNPDPSGAGLMKTALARDLVAAIDARFPTAACREGRAVGGLSMGGYGALLFALDGPNEFAAAISLSGSIAPLIEVNDRGRLKRADLYYDGVFGRPLDRERFNAWNLFTRLRMLEKGGGLRPDIYLSIGDGDRGGLLQSTVRFHTALRRAKVESTLRIGHGQHDWETWRPELVQALQWLGPKLDPTCGQEISSNAAPGGAMAR